VESYGPECVSLTDVREDPIDNWLMAHKPESDKEQDRPQQSRQQLPRRPRPKARPSLGQDGKQPIDGDYDDGLEEEEGAPNAEPARPGIPPLSSKP
jgi:hypothetical protein